MTALPAEHPRRLLIVWHSRTGTARALAAAVAAGAQGEGGVAVTSVPATEATTHQLLDADAYVFACPENLGSMSGAMKEMVDTHYYALLDRIAGRAVALVIAAGTDGEGAVRQWQRICTGWRLKSAHPPMIVRTGADTAQAIAAEKTVPDDALANAHALGQSLAAGLTMGVF